MCVCRQDAVDIVRSVALQALFVLEVNTGSKGTRGYSCKLIKTRCTRDIARYFFK